MRQLTTAVLVAAMLLGGSLAAAAAPAIQVMTAPDVASGIRDAMAQGLLTESFPVGSFDTTEILTPSAEQLTALERALDSQLVGGDDVLRSVAGFHQSGNGFAFQVIDTGEQLVGVATNFVASDSQVSVISSDRVLPAESQATPLCSATCSTTIGLAARGFEVCKSLPSVYCYGIVTFGTAFFCATACTDTDPFGATLQLATPSCTSATSCQVEGVGTSDSGRFNYVRGLVEWDREPGSIFVTDYFNFSTVGTFTLTDAYAINVLDTTSDSRAACAHSIRIDADAQTESGASAFSTVVGPKAAGTSC